MPCTYYFGGFPVLNSGDGIYNSGTVSYVNDWLFCGGMNAGVSTNSGSGKLWLANGIPQTTIFKNDYGFSEPLISVSPSNNIDVGLLPTMKSGINPSPQYSSLGAINIELSPNNGMASCNVTWQSLVLQYPTKGQLFPASLVPYITSPECRQLNTTPTDGFWGVNEKLFQVNYSGAVTNRGWINTRQGQAAPAWVGNTAYTVGQFVTASPDNQHVFECTTAGTSGATQPTWNTTSGGTTTDGTVTWTEEGQSALFAPLGPSMNASGDASVTGTLSVGTNLANQISVAGAASGSSPTISTAGSDTSIPMTLKSSGLVQIEPSGSAATAGTLSVVGQSGSYGFICLGTATCVPGSFYALAAETASALYLGAGYSETNIGSTTNIGTSSANDVSIAGAASGSSPSIGCGGDDTNVNCNITSKGTGVVEANGDAVVYNVVSGTLSVTPGASVGCTDATATATGAATTDLVSVTPQSVPSADTNISWQGYVSAANTVDIHVCTIVALTASAITFNWTVHN